MRVINGSAVCKLSYERHNLYGLRSAPESKSFIELLHRATRDERHNLCAAHFSDKKRLHATRASKLYATESHTLYKALQPPSTILLGRGILLDSCSGHWGKECLYKIRRKTIYKNCDLMLGGVMLKTWISAYLNVPGLDLTMMFVWISSVYLRKFAN